MSEDKRFKDIEKYRDKVIYLPDSGRKVTLQESMFQHRDDYWTSMYNEDGIIMQVKLWPEMVVQEVESKDG